MSPPAVSRSRAPTVTLAWVGVGCALTLAIAGMVASNARASGFGVERYGVQATEEGGSADTQAGSHPDALTAEAVLDPNAGDAGEDEVKNLTFALPAGMIVDPRAALQGGTVGEAQLGIGGKTISAPIYDLEPAPGELGRFGFTIDGRQIFASVAIGAGFGAGAGSYGMTIALRNIPQLGIESVKLSLGGGPPSLVTLPASCSASSQTTIRGESWGAQTVSLATPFQQLTGCEGLPFLPTLSVAPDAVAASEPSGYTLGLTVAQTEGSPVAAQAKEIDVALPAGVSVSLSATNGLSGCAEALFMPGSNAQESCPQSSKVGVVALRTPLSYQPLEGAVYLATPTGNPFGALIALYVEAEDPLSGVRIKLAGEMTLNPSTGQPTLRFTGLPQLPIAEIELHLFGGPRALLVNPPACGAAAATGDLAPWSGGSAVDVDSSFEITAGANGGPCASPPPFDPQVRVEPTAVPAGAAGGLVLSVSRSNAEQNLSRFSVALPAGVAWMFGDVPLCGESAVRADTCPPSAQIGSTILRVGPMPGLAWFTGPVYLTEAYGGGQYGLSLALTATAGPFDLGELVVRAAITSDSSTGVLTLVGDRLPQLLDGIPLQTSALEIDIEHPRLIVFPTVCAPRQVGVTVESVEGATVQRSLPFNVEGCQNPPAAPAGPGGARGAGTHPAPSAAVGRAITHIRYRFSRDRLLLTFKLLTRGTITIAGRGVRGYVATLRAGVHRVKLVLSHFGRFDASHHHGFTLTLALHAPGAPVGGYAVTATVERPGGRKASHAK